MIVGVFLRNAPTRKTFRFPNHVQFKKACASSPVPVKCASFFHFVSDMRLYGLPQLILPSGQGP